MEKEYRHNNKVAIYRSADGETQLSVEIDKDTQATGHWAGVEPNRALGGVC